MERRQIRELIGRFLHNDVPGELQTQFRRWMLQPGDGDEKEAALREEWTAVVESPAAADRSEELQRLRHTIRMREAQQRRSRIFRRIRYAAAAAAVLLLVRGETAVYAAVGLTGFAMACVFATFYAVATKAVPEKANEVAGILAISAGAVSGPVCGAIVRWGGDAHWGMLFVALCVGYMLWASFKLKIKQ